MPTHGGDALARGAARADFGMAGLDEEKWKLAFGEESLKKLNAMEESDRQKMIEEAQAKVVELTEQVEEQKRSNTADLIKRVIQDRIIVTRIEVEEKVGSFYVPDQSQEKPAEGIVIAVGPGKYVDGELQKPTVEVGDLVSFGKFAGQEVKIGFEQCLILREEDIFFVRNENSTIKKGKINADTSSETV